MVKLLLYIKHHLTFIWSIVEWCNSMVFYIIYGRKLKKATERLTTLSARPELAFRPLTGKDLPGLEKFFTEQPEDAFKFFNPHKFDLKSLRKVNRNRAFLMIGCYRNGVLAGYCFLRFFANRQAFRGKIVDPRFQGQGIAKEMGRLTTEICREMHFRLFATISKDNVKSIASSKAVNEVKIIKELPDGYYYVEYLNK